ncbi:DNA primase [Brevundimonas sp.]
MRFDERYIEELKARLRPSDVIGRSVKLKRQGREYVGLSPFSKEKSPSFFVNDDKGFFHDFSSGKHGDIISFLQETERLTFVEAVQRLAGEAGMALPAEDPQAAEREEKRKGLADWLDLSQKWFAANLRRSVGKAAREYLERRGLPEDQWERFGLGYAPNDREGVKQALVQRGAKPGDLVEAGMLIAPEGGGNPYDRFRDRLMFPILDARGRIVSFGGRAMNPDDRAKYLNGPESPLFHKGATLYGLPEARRLLGTSKDQPLVLVEGYMDVIACQRAGIPSVAPMGTALTEDQISLLWRTHHEPTICLDGDAAGQRAAARLIERALPLLRPDRSFKFAELAGGKDPDDVLRESGAVALKAQISSTRPLVDTLFRFELASAGSLDTPEQKAGLKARLRKSAGMIADKDLSFAYRDHLLDLYEGLWPLKAPAQNYSQAARVLGKRGAEKRWGLQKIVVTDELKASAAWMRMAPSPLSAAVAQGLIQHPEVLEERIETLATQGLGDSELGALLNDMIKLVTERGNFGDGLFRNRLDAMGHSETINTVAKSSPVMHAPFLDPETPQETARSLLSSVLQVLVEVIALNRALESMKTEDAFDHQTFVALKAQRDALSKSVNSGALWAAAEGNALH